MTCVLFCVPPSFVLINNKYILSCAIISSPLNESNEELRMKQWCLYLHSSFPFSRLRHQSRDNLSYYHLSSEGKKERERECFLFVCFFLSLTRQETDNVDTGRGW